MRGTRGAGGERDRRRGASPITTLLARNRVACGHGWAPEGRARSEHRGDGGYTPSRPIEPDTRSRNPPRDDQQRPTGYLSFLSLPRVRDTGSHQCRFVRPRTARCPTGRSFYAPLREMLYDGEDRAFVGQADSEARRPGPLRPSTPALTCASCCRSHRTLWWRCARLPPGVGAVGEQPALLAAASARDARVTRRAQVPRRCSVNRKGATTAS
jgi:hypothetical protein